MSKEYDLIVVGGGPAGYPAAIRGAQLGASVCLVEKERLGGVCLNRGCIPTKTMHALAHLVEQSAEETGGISGRVRPDIAGLMDHKREVVDGLVTGVEKILKGRGVDVIAGEARVTGPGEVEVTGHGTLRGGKMIVATGSSEIEIPGMRFDGKRILSSTDLLEIDRIPKSMIVVGGGVIGCEFASIFNAFGTEVTIVEMLPDIISMEDTHVIRFLTTYLKKKGISIHTKTRVESIDTEGDGVTAALSGGREISAEIALVSVGRTPNVAGTGLAEAGVEAERSGVKVGPTMETSVRGIYAAGDLVGGWLLAHVATREGVVAAENALGHDVKIDYSAVPATIYTLPEVASVGMTERGANEAGIETATGRFPFAANGKAKGLREEEGFVKWVAGKEDGRLLGLHVIGPQATELLPAGIMAISRKMTVSDFTSMILPHPTLCEVLGEAAEAVEGRAIHMLR